jgi:hypothetical protein
VEQGHRHLQHLLYRFLRCSRAETPQGSLPAFASSHVSTRIRPVTGRPSLFPTPIPASPLVGLTASLPSLRKERDGLTTFHKVDKDGLGALCSPVAWNVHDRVPWRPCAHYSAILAQASQHLWLVDFDDVYREFTCVHHTANPAPSPPDAGRDTVPSRFGCQSGDCGSVVRGHWTARDLAAVPRRILLMEQQVWSIQLARQSTLRPRVAAMAKARGFQTTPRGVSRGPFRPRIDACVALPPSAPGLSFPTAFPRQPGCGSPDMRVSCRWNSKGNLCRRADRLDGNCRASWCKGQCTGLRLTRRAWQQIEQRRISMT